jgi:hypothetical protein
MSAVTRALTRGNFDHVGMVLKFDSDENEVYFVEATGNHGVALNKWSSIKGYIGINKFYERIIFRHVDFERNDDMVENLEKFLKEALG